MMWKEAIMKVLITGGYGFIGSHTAERFYKEGYEVYIIDNLSTGKKDNLNIKHKFYELSVTDEKCVEVFESANFDVVVHLAALSDISNSIREPHIDAQTNILGLINMLKLANKYKVNKFIFASSASVYDKILQVPLTENDRCVPDSPYDVSKLTGEQYCGLFKSKYGLETICLRFSNVYGPRQNINGENGLIGEYINKILCNEQIDMKQNKEERVDFIYVLDVVDAIYKSVEFCSSDILNISVNRQENMNTIVEILKNKHTTNKPQFFMVGGSLLTHWKPQTTVLVNYIKNDNKNFINSPISNEKAIKELNWAPIYSLEQGINKTYDWYKKNYKKKDAKPNKEKKEKKQERYRLLKELLPYLENIFAFIIVYFLSKYSEQYDISDIIDFKLIYIIVIGIVYGLKQSSIAIVLSCGLFVHELGQSGQDIVSLIYNVNTLISFSLYIFIGTVLGYTTYSKKVELDIKNNEMEEMKDKFRFLHEMYDESKLVRTELQNQIISSEDSFGKIYKITSALDAFEPEKVFAETVKVIEEIMKSKDVYIFSVSKEQNYLRLISKSKDSQLNIRKSLRVEDYIEIENIIETKEIYVNKKLDPLLPMMMSPIVVDNKVIALIAIYTMEFETLSLYNQNLLKVVSDLIKSSLSRAYQYNQAIIDEKYISGTSILNNDYFNVLLYRKIEAKQKNNTDFILLKVKDENWVVNDIPNKIGKTIREFDYIGVGNNDELYVLLSNTKKEEAEYVIERLNNMDISTEFVEEDEYYETVTHKSLVS